MICKKRPWVNKQTGEHGAQVWIFCPGCKIAHALEVENKERGVWQWNESDVVPSFSPSLLVTGGEFKCHSYITNGNIRFLSDSTHELSGQTVPLPPLPEWLAE